MNVTEVFLQLKEGKITVEEASVILNELSSRQPLWVKILKSLVR